MEVMEVISPGQRSNHWIEVREEWCNEQSILSSVVLSNFVYKHKDKGEEQSQQTTENDKNIKSKLVMVMIVF